MRNAEEAAQSISQGVTEETEASIGIEVTGIELSVTSVSSCSKVWIRILAGPNGSVVRAMTRFEGIKVTFIAGFGPVVRDSRASRKLYRDVLGIRFTPETGGYLHTEALPGAKTFALWPLAQAAQSCFGRRTWPKNVPVPQAWLEFDVDDVTRATAQLAARGYRLLVNNRQEPWGQTVSRFLSPEGLLVGVTFTPALRTR